MTTLFYREPRLVALIILVIIAAGLGAFSTIGRQEDPTITNLFATVTTPYPGADPARVEALVTEKIEQELRKISEIKHVDSTSRSGVSSIVIMLDERTDPDLIDQVWTEVRDAIDAALPNLPPTVPKPVFDKDKIGAYTSISAIFPRNGEVSPAMLGRFAEVLQDRLRSVAGTQLVSIYGQGHEEVLVELDAGAFSALGLTPAQIAASVRNADAKVQAGRLRGANSEMLLEVSGELRTIDQISAIPVATSRTGQVTRLGDVARISRTLRNPPDSVTLVDGKPAVLVASRMDADLQVDVWMDRTRAVLERFEADLPDGLEHRQLFDQSAYTFERLNEIALNMAMGVALVILVLFFTLGFRPAIVVAIILPLVTLASLATLNMLGIPIHQMSVTGLIVALGLLVDAAIVVTDQIRQSLKAGLARTEAVGGAVQRLAMPLLASTVTTALAFMPMILLPGPAGDFVGAIAIAVVVMLAWSLVLALTVTPALAGWWLVKPVSGDIIHRRREFWLYGARGGRVGRLFGQSIRWSLASPVQSICLSLVLPVLGFAALGTLVPQFFPTIDRDQFHIEVELPSGAPIEATTQVVREIDAMLRDDPGIRQIAWVIGRNAPPFYYNMPQRREQTPNFAHALLTTQSADVTAALVPELQVRLDAAVPGALVLVRDLVQGPPVTAPVELRFVGPSQDVLRALGDRARQTMAGLDVITHVTTSIEGGAPKLVFDLDEQKVRLAGLDLVGVASQLDGALEGIAAGSVVEGSEELPLRLRVSDADRADLALVRSLPLVAPDGSARAAAGQLASTPLSALGTPRLVPAQSVIERRDGERINVVRGFLRYGVLPQQVQTQVQQALADEGFQIPQGYRLEYGGDSDARSDTVTNLASSMGLIVTLSIAVIVLTFNSFRLSAVALVVVALSGGLSLLALAIFQYPFGIQAIIGVIGSVGVSINAAIIIMTALQADQQASSGDTARMGDIVIDASRHIVSTTITTFGGFLPLILAGGGFWPPFAMAIAGGVLLSAIISFYFTPPMFALVYPRRTASRADQRAARLNAAAE